MIGVLAPIPEPGPASASESIEARPGEARHSAPAFEHDGHRAMDRVAHRRVLAREGEQLVELRVVAVGVDVHHDVDRLVGRRDLRVEAEQTPGVELPRLAAKAGDPDPEVFADRYVMVFEGALVLRQVYGRNDAAHRALPMIEALIEERL